MHDSFKTFLTGTKRSDKAQYIPENKVPTVIVTDPRTKILQEKVAYFVKKYGEIGADALDDFFKESVQKFSGFKNNTIYEKNYDEFESSLKNKGDSKSVLEALNKFMLFIKKS